MTWDHETIPNAKRHVIGNFSKVRSQISRDMVVKFVKDYKTDYQLLYDVNWNPKSVTISIDGRRVTHDYPNGLIVFYAVEAEIAEYINQVGGD